MIERVGDRFERRLAEEIAKFRIEMAQGFAALGQAMTAGCASIRQENAETRVELLEWTFVFWVSFSRLRVSWRSSCGSCGRAPERIAARQQFG